jgi:hypothetical protein
MRTPVLLLVFSLAPALAAGGPLVGKPLPGLSLSHPLQGAAWSTEDMKGMVVVLDVFQLG